MGSGVITVPGSTLVVVRKKWSAQMRAQMAEYKCSKCGHTFLRKFHDAYPEWCPICNRRFHTVKGKMGAVRSHVLNDRTR